MSNIDLKLVLALLSFAFAIWQAFQRYRLSQYLKADSFEHYQQTGILLGDIQRCTDQLSQNNVLEAMRFASSAQGLAQSLFTRSIRNIHYYYSFKKKTIETWVTNNKINAIHKGAFDKFAEK